MSNYKELRSIRSIIRLVAVNDTNGNPRRVWVGLDRNSNIVRVWDEGGYLGRGAVTVGAPPTLRDRLNRLAGNAPTFDTTPSEYHALLRNFKNGKE